MLRKTCDDCGSDYEARSARSRFCSDACRVRSSRKSSPPDPEVVSSDPLVKATTRELEAAGKLDTRIGHQALALARRMATGIETGGGVAALSRELRSVLDAAIGGKASGSAPVTGAGSAAGPAWVSTT